MLDLRAGGLRPEDEIASELRENQSTPEDEEILCAACGHGITRSSHRTQAAGSHVHRRVNPHGLEFEFGCFSEAPGASVLGRPTAQHTWFPGFLWSYSRCNACTTHLGWFFESTARSFHGLILERLVAGRPAA